MQTEKVNQKSRNNDPGWYFLAEYNLDEGMVDINTGGEPTAGTLFQNLRDMGIPPECLKEIERTITSFAGEAKENFNQGKRKLPVCIRLFCQGKTVKNAYSAKTSDILDAGKIPGTASRVRPSNLKMNGGWGYFLIERGWDISADLEKFHSRVDLYLYKEGE